MSQWPSDLDADVIVIGAGLSGCCAALQLSEHGLSVLVIEAGPGGAPRPRSRLQRILNRIGEALGAAQPSNLPYYSLFTRETETARMRPVPTRLGRVLGGSSTVYAAALGRFKRSDFVREPEEGAPEGTLPTGWPTDYDDFLQYYRRAETLMRVHGERDPGDSDDDSGLLPSPSLGEGAEAIRKDLIGNGLLPYRLHVAIDYLPGCRECFGFSCALACKGDGYNRALERALASGLVRVETEHQVLRIERPFAGRVQVVVASPDLEGRSDRTARQVVVAAGSLNTPLLLERSSALWQSGSPPAALGRGLMFHVSDLFILDDDASHAGGPQKWLGFRDFYNDGEVNLGEVQSVGIGVSTGTVIQAMRFYAARHLGTSVRPLTELARPLAWLAARIIGPRAIYATITEDRPHLANRVSFENGRIVTTYATDPALVAHARAMRGRLRAAFAPHRLRFISRPGTPNWGHPLGTCRMGNDPATSVVDADGRLHDHPEISVCDASVFPTSGGTGPSLTVIALALRAADRLAGELHTAISAAAGAAVDDLGSIGTGDDKSSGAEIRRRA